MITADQLLCHAIGDYVLQSDWMATEKTKKSIAALCHVLTYSIPFLLLRPSLSAIAVIVFTHFVIDRWRLARFVVWAKNFIAPAAQLVYYNGREESSGWRYNRETSWFACKATGYPPTTPPFLAVWLLIITDNIMHIAINGLALKYL